MTKWHEWVSRGQVDDIGVTKDTIQATNDRWNAISQEFVCEGKMGLASFS